VVKDVRRKEKMEDRIKEGKEEGERDERRKG
jgi:hypothetical protein